ncbi:MAG: selenocysteine-specific translation elongation factor [Chloroflexi bacterium]|nr:selenocysteine-specific translation elongation factor [Chloroflexota bacterium]
MFVVGTAGHVDHGKSTLIRALTGINPDRLREEQVREMTIDLGFAWLVLPSGREVSVVDVPGHEDFIKNMLAGVGSIDIALFVVAADEAVMPQTREHLAILDLLQVRRALVALTKSDLIQDPEWLELVEEDVREELQGTVLEDAPIIPVSARTGPGLEELLAEMDRLLDSVEPRPDLGRPRLSVDRVFTISGFGTVVTGTLIDGRFRVGEEVAIVPGGLRARIRGLQMHKSQVEVVTPGSRVAINLGGIPKEDVQRGQVVTRPGWLEPTTLVDAHLRVLGSAPFPVTHNMTLEVFTGAARTLAYVRLLDAKELAPGAEGWVQLRLSDPLAVVRGDRYIVRLPSPSVTVGGGKIVQTNPGRRHRRFRAEVITRLEALAHGTPEEMVMQLLGRGRVTPISALVARGDVPVDELAGALDGLARGGQVVVLSGTVPPAAELAQSGVGVLTHDGWMHLLSEIREALGAYHQRFPLRVGMPREELKSRLQLDGSLFQQVLERAEREGQIVSAGAAVRLAGHEVSLAPPQQKLVTEVMAAFRANPFTPPSLADVEQKLGGELLQYLLDQGKLVKVSEAVLFDAEGYAEMERRIVQYLREHKQITVAEVRDLLGTSRKYALGLLEDLDRRRITKRMGDIRILR